MCSSALALQPEIILFDEAISSLDAHTQVQIMDLLRDQDEETVRVVERTVEALLRALDEQQTT
mgnify:CR=1 FL=1